MRALATVVWLLAACGGKTAPTLPDGTDVDASPDAPDESARVDVNVIPMLAPPSPAAVAMFMDPTGALVSDGPVDADGNAHGYLPQGGSVTVLQVSIDPDARRFDMITTIRGVKPGDHLHVGQPPPATMQTGNTDVMTASYSATTNNLEGLMSCGYPFFYPTSQTANLTFYASCAEATFDILAIEELQPRQFVWLVDVPHVPDGTVTIPNTWQPFETITLTVNDVPANAVGVSGELDTFLRSVPGQMGFDHIDLPTPGTHQLSLSYPPAAGTGTMIQAATGIGGGSSDQFVQVLGGPPTAMTIDFASLPLPAVMHPMQTVTGLSWTETGSGTGDMRVLYWPASWTDIGNAIPHQVIWTIVDDPANVTTSITLPGLPDLYATEDPTKQDNVVLPLLMSRGTVTYVDYDNLDGYDAARPYGAQLANVAARFIDVPHIAHYKVPTVP